MFNIEGTYCSIKRDSTFLTVMTKTQGLSSEVLSLRAIIIKLLLVAVACTVQGFAVGVREAPLKILAPSLRCLKSSAYNNINGGGGGGGWRGELLVV